MLLTSREVVPGQAWLGASSSHLVAGTMLVPGLCYQVPMDGGPISGTSYKAPGIQVRKETSTTSVARVNSPAGCMPAAPRVTHNPASCTPAPPRVTQRQLRSGEITALQAVNQLRRA